MANEAVSVTLGGIPLDSFAPIRWRLAAGVEPVQEYIEVHYKTAEALLALKDEPQTLVIDIPGHTKATFEGIWILSAAPGSRPDTLGVLISDIRWKWSRKLIKRSFNIRRRSGARRRLGPNGTPIQVAPIADDIDFQPWSLMKPDGTPANGGGDGLVRWKPKDALKNVMTELAASDDPGGAPTFAFDIPEDAIVGEASFEMIELIDQGGAALGRLLTYVPPTDLYVDKGGRVVFFNRLSGLEFDEINGNIPYVSGPVPKFIPFDQVRPSRVEVYFTPELEVRLDSVLAKSSVTADDRMLTNVLPLPDPNTTIDGRTYSQGTWYPFGQELYDAWNATFGHQKPINDEMICRLWWEGKMQSYYSHLGSLGALENWPARVAAVHTHYRQTYQIARRWMDRMHSIRAYRVGILDPENGTRAPSQAYTDHCIKANDLTIRFAGDNWARGVNVLGYARLLKDAKAAPAEVSILDGDIGILRVDYQVDPWGVTADVYPSAVDDIPTADISDLTQSLWWYGAKLSGGGVGPPKLKASHRLAVVITAAPAAPNDKRQMYKRVVTPAEVQHIPGVGLGAAKGPVWQVWVGPQITARFMWSDDYAHVIDAAFGAGGLADVDLEPLLINEPDVDAVAKAIAAEVYSSFTNRWQGGMQTMVNANVEPKGNLLDVAHTVETDGTPHTSFSLPAERARLDPWANLPASTRRIISREVQP
jgi:hypothetical protein